MLKGIWELKADSHCSAMSSKVHNGDDGGGDCGGDDDGGGDDGVDVNWYV